jgi:hypothetical protein
MIKTDIRYKIKNSKGKGNKEKGKRKKGKEGFCSFLL